MKKYITSENFLLLGCIFIAIGIPCDGFARGFENTGLISIMFSGAIEARKGWKRNLLSNLNVLLALLFLVCIFSYFYSLNIQELNRKAALKVLFLLFPLAFTFSPAITHRIKRITVFLFTVTTALLALLSCVRYFLHFEEYNLLISQSKPIEIVGGTMHIYFSVIMAVAVFLGVHLLNKNFKIIINGVTDKIIFSAVLINVAALHVLSARTGLLAFYAALIVVLLRYSIVKGKYRTLIGGLFAMFLFPAVMYFTVPSVKSRFNNTYDDLNRYFTGDYVGYYSISGRFETWKAAFHIFKAHPLFGVGTGDLESHLEAQYKIDNTRLMREESLPNCHNQYIETLATHGIIGFGILIALLVSAFILVKKMPSNNYVMLAFLTVFASAFMVESLLERQAGVTLFLFFLLFLKNNATDRVPTTKPQ